MSSSDNFELEKYNSAALIKDFKKMFGSWVSVEEIIEAFNRISINHQMAQEALKSFSDDELTNLHRRLNMGLNKAKDDGFQCIYKDCIRTELSCISCPFMVMNFYSLTHLASEFSRLMIDSRQKFNDDDAPEAEKVYLTRMLVTYSSKLKQAIDKFGEDIVSEFFTEFQDNLNEVRRMRDQLPCLEDYVTILSHIDELE